MNAEDRYISDAELCCACCGGSGHKDDVWKPASTAPKDGRMFLVCYPRMMNLRVRCWFDTVHGYFKTDEGGDGGISTPAFFHDGDLWANMPDAPTT